MIDQLTKPTQFKIQDETIQNFAQNIVDTVREPLLMLDTTLRVHSANRAFYQTFQVSQEETENRLIYELGNGQWDIPALRTLLEDIVPRNSAFNDFELVHTFPVLGRRVMLLNARKLKAGDHGELLVLAMEDVTDRRHAEEAVIKAAADLKAVENFAQNIVDTVREPLLMLDTTLRVHSANRAFYQTFQVSQEETENRLIYELGNGQWDIPALRTLLEDVVPKSSVFNDFELVHTFPVIGRRVMLLNARKLRAGAHSELLVLAIEDVTAEWEARREIKALNARLQVAVAEVNHRVKNNLQIVAALIEMQANSETEPLPPGCAQRLTVHIHTLANIHDLLTESTRTTVDSISLGETLSKLIPMLQATVTPRRVQFTGVELRLSAKLCTALALITNELVSNAFKHSKGNVGVELLVVEGSVYLRVVDNGAGFPPNFNPKTAANLGLGLVETLSRHDMGGGVRYATLPEGGGCVTVSFPLPKAPLEAEHSQE